MGGASKEHEHVLFDTRNRYFFVYVLIMAPAMVGLVFYVEGPHELMLTGIMLGALVPLAILGLFFAIPFRQLGQVSLVGTDLIGRRINAIDLGQRLRFPLAEISNWQVDPGVHKYGRYVSIQFEHRGQQFSFHPVVGEKVDWERLAQLVPDSAWPGGKPLWPKLSTGM